MKNLIFALVLFTVSLTGCNSYQDKSTDTISTIFKSDAEKIAFMEKYYSPKFHYEDVEYHIMYSDNGSGLVPGPSDWTMLFAFKLDSSEIEKISLSEESGTIKVDNWKQFLPKNSKWNIDYPRALTTDGHLLVGKNNILLIELITR